MELKSVIFTGLIGQIVENNRNLVAAMMAYWKYLQQKPDWEIMAKVMEVLGTPASASAIQQHFEKAYRERVVRPSNVLSLVAGE